MTRLFWLLCIVIVGLVALRGFDIVSRLSAPYPVTVAFAEGGDDAYYYFTVARNIARGRGITIDGTHWTSGFQPLWGLITGLIFLIPSERATFAVIYLTSLACWLGSAVLVVRFVRCASTTPVGSFLTAAIVALFLCERQLSSLYVNGMETGLHCLLVLGLLVAFQGYFQRPIGCTDRLAALKLGAIAGLAMLARNDVVFLCGALLGALLLETRRPHRVRDGAVIVAVAAVLVLPWLAYCQWVAGSPVPQSGIATSDSLRHISEPATTQGAIAISSIPVLFLGTQRVIAEHALSLAILGGLVIAGLSALVLSPSSGVTNASSRRCLLALMTFALVVLVYYPIVSAAVQFYDRYFATVKVLALLLVFLLLVWGRQRVGARGLFDGAVTMLVLLAFGTNVYQIGREVGVPWKSHMGQPTLEILASRYASDNSRLGMMESGRLGYLFPDRVVNLDGKMNVEALQALRTGTMVEFLKKSNLDHIVLHGYDVAFFDQRFPAWRQLFAPDDRLKAISLFSRTPSRSRE